MPAPFRIGRRNFLGIGMLGGLSVLPVPATVLAGRPPGSNRDRPGKAKNVLVILEQGGMSHIDTWDPKPAAVADHVSPYRPIATNVPGMQFTELLSKTAKVADKLSVIRSMHHTSGQANGHPQGTQYTLSGHVPGGPVEMPDIGSVVAHRIDTDCKYLAPYIMAPGNHEQAKESRLGFLPPRSQAFKTGGRDLSEPGWKVPGLGLNEAIGKARFLNRMNLLGGLDIGLPVQASSGAEGWEEAIAQAQESLLHPNSRTAFDLEQEPDKLRDEYGRGHRGQCYLLGRRLIEQGVRFVTIDVREPMTDKTPGGNNLNWDHHDYIYATGTCNLPGAGGGGRGRYGIGTWWMMGSVDQAFSTLIRDMDDRGMLEETLVCFVTEFGRTPKINKFQGRDHWTGAYSIVMAGAGTPGGQVIGASDRQGGYVEERACTPDDYAATIYRKLGLNLDEPLYTRENRPIFLAANGKPIPEVF
ncbi:DUF1501 domain-containing protein [Lignipirellula cremea]|uniref:DUF1501 domain-containing protein n=1 Tax=Lignipirellula cremea TaxID=2528010 RepID=A0A518E2S1_9BACT|nr:DUF1501 domain-containing protein [Lignipirellula cremea]QDU98390.1 hypothetical protein Pla8534_62580 [Lignipirellula cremea]